jgi:hypothetical protein
MRLIYKSIDDLVDEEFERLIKIGSYPNPSLHDKIIMKHGIEKGISIGLKLKDVK